MAPIRLTPANSVVVVVDIQDKLLAKIPRGADLVRNTLFLLDVANLIDVPVLAAEQYPKGLGPTHEPIRRRISTSAGEKTAFSCAADASFRQRIQDLNRSHVILVGMETHVCVLQTALELMYNGLNVVLPVDAVESRHDVDKETALHRLDRAGAVLATVETVGFEWIADSQHPRFKDFSKLVIQRG